MDNQNEKTKKSFFDKIGASFRRKGFRSGLYAAVTSILVIVAVVIVNLIVSATGIQKDLTTTGEKSLTNETKELLVGLEDDFTVYILTKDGKLQEGFASYYEMYIDLYEHASDRITFELVDLVLHPEFAEKYTDKNVVQDSIVVVNENTGLSKYISFFDIVLTETTLDQNTFQYKNVPVGLDIEGQLNAAIRYVVSGQETNFYEVTGHGEKMLGTAGKKLLGKANIVYNTFESMTASQVPEDCDVLMIKMPSKDYTEEELNMFKAYADRGGAFLILAEKMDNLTNYDSLLAYCGVQAEKRIILEGDAARHDPTTQLVIYPIMESANEIMKNLSGANYLPLRNAYLLSTIKETAHEIKVSKMLSTSDAAYAKSLEGGKISSTKQEGDPVGPFYVGLHLENTETKSEAVVLSGGYVFDDKYLEMSNYANASLLTDSVNHMTDAGELSAIRTLSFDTEEKLTINAAQANTIAIVLVIVVPVLLIVAGVCIMLRRRNR